MHQKKALLLSLNTLFLLENSEWQQPEQQLLRHLITHVSIRILIKILKSKHFFNFNIRKENIELRVWLERMQTERRAVAWPAMHLNWAFQSFAARYITRNSYLDNGIRISKDHSIKQILLNDVNMNSYVVYLYMSDMRARGVPAKYIYNLLKDLDPSRTCSKFYTRACL